MLSNLLHIGLTKTISFEDSVRIKFFNSASLLFASVLIYFVFYHVVFTHLYHVAAIQFLFLLSVPLTLFLQAREKQKSARVVLFIAIHSIIFMTSMVVLVGHGNEYYYIATSILILSQVKKTSYATIFIFLNLVLYLLPHFYYPAINEHYKMVSAISVFITPLLAVRFFMIIQKQYREELKAQKERLIELNIEKNDLMSIVAHDLKSPLAQIKGLVSILELEGSKLNDGQKELIKKIKGVTTKQDTQITAFLGARALEEKIEAITFTEFDIVNNIKLVLNNMEAIAKSKQIALKYSYDSPQINTIGNEDFINKIMSNLISNAIKYSQPNSIVRVEVTSDKNELLIMVKDQGQGFKTSDLNKVFLKNEVLSAKPTANETATGMGLYIVKKYVEILNGWVWLESSEGKGSTFFVKLPKAV